ncbi:hypothetical protein LCGC14_0274760 [marine sediment metagenome]|uniref:Polysaccharide biosynthesis protein C-terminal domain-containing protein n=1 Tax=marine sediment metagenome TaxID=412755 RepID=A0A0F9X304_9ZZZZ
MPMRPFAVIPKLLRTQGAKLSSVYLVSSVAQQLAVLLLIPVFTHHLTTDEYGLVALLMSMMLFVRALVDMGQPAALIRYYYAPREETESHGDLLLSAIVLRLVTAGVFLGAMFVALAPAWGWITNNRLPLQPHLSIVLLAAVGGSVNELVHTIFKVQQRAGAYAAVGLLTTLIQLASSVVYVVVLKLGPLSPVLGCVTGSVGVALPLVVWSFLKPSAGRLRRAVFWRHLRYGLPLVGGGAARWLQNGADRLVLNRVAGGSLGPYNLGYNMAFTGMSVMFNSIGNALQPIQFHVMQTRKDSPTILRALASVYVALLGAVCMTVVLYARELVAIIAPASYALAGRVLPLIAVAYLCHGYYLFVRRVLLFHKKTVLVSVLTIVPCLLALAGNILLIPRWGIDAAIWVLLGSVLATLAATFIAARRVDATRYPLAAILVTNIMIAAAALWLTYGPAEGVTAAGVAIKLVVLGVYLALVWIMFIRPHERVLLGLSASDGPPSDRNNSIGSDRDVIA